ncbi:MAG: rod shape-determining protein MreD [Candidatus Moranbacteria bacterium]|nr:rod shape-determining protein MreD [Candidatus Moranbacteria bacterium]
MRKMYLFLFVLILFILQYSILGVFFRSGRIPNLFVALTVSLAIIFGFEKSLGWTVLAGFFLDVGSSWLIGSGILALVVILWLIDKMKAIAELRSKRYLFAVLLFFTAGISSVVFDALMGIIFKTEGFFSLSISASHSFPSLGADYALKTVYTAASVIPVYFFARKIPKRSEIFLARNKR